MKTAFRLTGGAKTPKPTDLQYQRLLDDAEAAIDLFTLAEKAEDDLLDAIIPLDAYLESRGMDRSIVHTYLTRAVQNLYYRIESANSIETVLTELKKSGAVVIDAAHVYLPPDHGRLTKATSDTPRNYEVKTEPRLAWALAALKTLRIYGDDLIVRVGRVDKDMMREHPYIVLEIPRINKQIILCEQVGNRTFVSHEILDPQHFEKLKKSLLRGLSCVTDFVGGNDWGKTLLSHVTGNAEDFVVGAKVENLAFKEAARKPKKIKLTEDIIAQAAKEWAAGHEGVYPISSSDEIEEGLLAGRTWTAVDMALREGRVEGLPRGTTLAKFLEIKGLKISQRSETRKLTQEIIVQAAKEWAAGHDGVFPITSSGEIKGGLLSGRNWEQINGSLKLGYVEGLPKGYSLAKLLEARKFKVSQSSEARKLTLQMLEQGIKEWMEGHDGYVPKQSSGLIKTGILQGRTWKSVELALYRGDVEDLPRGTTLAKFLEIKGLKISQRSETRKLTQEIIVEAAKEWAVRHGGKFPTEREKKAIETGDLAGRTWISVHKALGEGRVEGLPRGTCKGLAHFLEMKGLKIRINSEVKKLTEVMILQGLIESAEEDKGKLPVVLPGKIKKGILKGDSWQAIHVSLAQGLRDLPKGKYKGLGDFKTQFDVAGKYEAYKAVKAVVGFVQNIFTPPAP